MIYQVEDKQTVYNLDKFAVSDCLFRGTITHPHLLLSNRHVGQKIRHMIAILMQQRCQ